MRVPDRGWNARIGDPDHQVSIGGMLLGQFPPHRHAGLKGGLPIEHAIRPREVNLLEDAERRLWRILHQIGAQASLVQAQDFARLHVAHQVSANGVQGATLRGDQPVAIAPAKAERPQAMRVAHGEEGIRRQDSEGVGPGRELHHAPDTLFPRPLPMQDQQGKELAVRACRRFHTALEHQAAQF